MTHPQQPVLDLCRALWPEIYNRIPPDAEIEGTQLIVPDKRLRHVAVDVSVGTARSTRRVHIEMEHWNHALKTLDMAIV